MNNINYRVTGVQINYYHLCFRKLWLFSHHIQMEQNSSLVALGTILHEQSYKRKKKEIQIGGIKIDFLDAKRGVIHEVKKSKAMELTHVWQLKYYLYVFEQLGLMLTGEINYPKLKHRLTIELEESDRDYLDKVLKEINEIISQTILPEVISAKRCKKCSYYELCYI